MCRTDKREGGFSFNVSISTRYRGFGRALKACQDRLAYLCHRPTTDLESLRDQVVNTVESLADENIIEVNNNNKKEVNQLVNQLDLSIYENLNAFVSIPTTDETKFPETNAMAADDGVSAKSKKKFQFKLDSRSKQRVEEKLLVFEQWSELFPGRETILNALEVSLGKNSNVVRSGFIKQFDSFLDKLLTALHGGFVKMLDLEGQKTSFQVKNPVSG